MVKSRDSSPTAWVWAWICHLLTVGHDWETQQQQLPLTSCVTLGNVLNFSVPQLPSSVKWEWKCYLPRQLLGGLMTCFSESSVPDILQALPTAEWVAVPLPLFVACSVVSDSLRPHGLQHARLSRPPPSPRVCSNSCPLSRWCYLTIPSSASPFSFICKSPPHQSSYSLLYLILKPWFWHPRPSIPQPHSLSNHRICPLHSIPETASHPWLFHTLFPWRPSPVNLSSGSSRGSSWLPLLPTATRAFTSSLPYFKGAEPAATESLGLGVRSSDSSLHNQRFWLNSSGAKPKVCLLLASKGRKPNRVSLQISNKWGCMCVFGKDEKGYNLSCQWHRGMHKENQKQ